MFPTQLTAASICPSAPGACLGPFEASATSHVTSAVQASPTAQAGGPPLRDSEMHSQPHVASSWHTRLPMNPEPPQTATRGDILLFLSEHLHQVPGSSLYISVMIFDRHPKIQKSKGREKNMDGRYIVGGRPVRGDGSLMDPKAHGTTATPVQPSLRWNVSVALAKEVCSFYRTTVEPVEDAHYFVKTSFLKEIDCGTGDVFYDSVSGKPLFAAPRNRTVDEFLKESMRHGWLSFRDAEVVWAHVRVLERDNEVVSVDGTHLGHNFPDKLGNNRYCVNIASVAGQPTTAPAVASVHSGATIHRGATIHSGAILSSSERISGRVSTGMLAGAVLGLLIIVSQRRIKRTRKTMAHHRIHFMRECG